MKRLWIAVALVLGGCAAPAHLSEHFGLDTDAWFTRQEVRPKGTSAVPVSGLDSQEATLISDKYRRSLGPKTAASSQQPQMLYVAPGVGSNQTSSLMPPPSVPPEQDQ